MVFSQQHNKYQKYSMATEKKYKEFTDKLLQEMVSICSRRGFLEGVMQSSVDIDYKWDALAKDYFADAVKEFNKYPVVSIAWAGYLGMAVAHRWDQNINLFKEDKYEDFYGEKKFDDMDEHIVRDILKIPLNSDKARKISDLLIDCSTVGLNMIKAEGIEPGTREAFEVFIEICKVMFTVGAAVELKRLGYKMVPYNMGSGPLS